MRICDLFGLFRYRKATEPTSRRLITSENAAIEYARVCCGYPEGGHEKLNEYYQQGRILFADMSRFDDDSRRQSLESFSREFIVPLAKEELKRA